MVHWFLKSLLYSGILLILAGSSFAGFIYFKWQVFVSEPIALSEEARFFIIPEGATAKKISRALERDRIIQSALFFQWLIQSEGMSQSIQAGEYRIENGITPLNLLHQFNEGKVYQHAFTIVSGWNFSELLSAVSKEPYFDHTLENSSWADITHALQIPYKHPEGLFYPETYYFTAHTKDIDFLKRAYLEMEKQLNLIWEKRTAELPFSTPYEALIMASIIEKETALLTEQTEISGVYARRLFKNMKLQADPTVNYALNKDRRIPLTHQDLITDSPYNTYFYLGLPPTPIAIPSGSAMLASVTPASGKSLYFVANGEGGHFFSETLTEHKKAVERYRNIRKAVENYHG